MASFAKGWQARMIRYITLLQSGEPEFVCFLAKMWFGVDIDASTAKRWNLNGNKDWSNQSVKTAIRIKLLPSMCAGMLGAPEVCFATTLHVFDLWWHSTDHELSRLPESTTENETVARSRISRTTAMSILPVDATAGRVVVR